MSDKVWITLIVCITILGSIWMIRSALKKLAESDKDSFTFAARFPLGAGRWLFRGDHKPSPEALPKIPKRARRNSEANE